MTPAVAVALLTCSIAALFDLRIAAGLGLSLTCLLLGRDPLWLVEHGARWLRAALIRWACIASWRVLQRFAGAKELVVEER